MESHPLIAVGGAARVVGVEASDGAAAGLEGGDGERGVANAIEHVDVVGEGGAGGDPARAEDYFDYAAGGVRFREFQKSRERRRH